MISRLTRILMALVTAFVFTGQMEAAAQHCARLAQTAASEAAAIVAAAEQNDPPCHESKASVAEMHAAMSHDHAAPDHSGHTKSSPHCECIAALTGWIDVDGATTSTHVEAYAWLVPSETSFASATPDPDLRPPRA
ncbi:MAG: hypothetical protein ABMA14_09450 [Hyphomonadaceae bacterium]